MRLAIAILLAVMTGTVAQAQGRDGSTGRAETGFPESERGYDGSPFTREESSDMSRVWGEIREAARYEDINWPGIGFKVPPGDHDARRLMSRNWGQLRKATRFE